MRFPQHPQGGLTARPVPIPAEFAATFAPFSFRSKVFQLSIASSAQCCASAGGL